MARRRVHHNPVLSRTMEALVSGAVVYLFTPTLQKFLAPLQAQLNADALNNGQTPTNNGLSTVANQLVQIIPTDNPTVNSPAVVTPTGNVPVQAVGPLQTTPVGSVATVPTTTPTTPSA